MKNPSPKWVVIPHPNRDAKLRLFCFSYAGGNPHIFRHWSERLPRQIEICAIQLPGRGNRIFEEPYTRIEPLINDLSAQLERFNDLPFACFGHSMGALLAFEWLRFLRRSKQYLPETMLLSGCVAPQLYEREKALHALPENELIEELNDLGGTPSELLENKELMQLILPTLRADFELLHFYEYKSEPPFDLPFAAFGGKDDKEVDFARLEAWREQTRGEFFIEMFAGNHFYLLESEGELLKAINKKLHKVLDKKITV